MSGELKRKKFPLILAVIGILILLGAGTFFGVRYLLMRTRLASGPQITVLQPADEKPLLLRMSNPVNVSAASPTGKVAVLEWYSDGMLAGRVSGGEKELNAIWKWTPQQEGAHKFSFLAYDEQGSMSLVSMDVAALSDADLDADQIPDALDACPSQAGPAASAGCLLAEDADQDGLTGEADVCPEEAGSTAGLGCPRGALADGDTDGIADARDRCPAEGGLPDWEGCPLSAWSFNRDGDELPDFLDACPADYGGRDAEGCPSPAAGDSDGDGTQDAADDCPEIPGSHEAAGCPVTADSDSDGIADETDHCPEEAGLMDEGGCLPEDLLNDVDMDGVLDTFDACPEAAGSLDNNGCPLPDDSDGDGILNNDDNCPDLAGSADNGGCPYRAFPMFEYARQFRLFPQLLDPCDFDSSRCAAEAAGSESGVGGGGDGDLDGDGLLDVDDRCLYEPGDPYWFGCPRPGDRDTDGKPDEEDDCPDIPGSAPNGCVNAGEKYHLLLNIVSFEAEPVLQGVYCYGQTNGTPRYPRTPAWGFMPEDYYTMYNGQVVLYEDQYVYLDIECWAQPDDISAPSEYLGSIHRPLTFAFWDGQIRKALGVGPGGSFEIWFRIQPLSYYEM